MPKQEVQPVEREVSQMACRHRLRSADTVRIGLFEADKIYILFFQFILQSDDSFLRDG